MPLSTLRTKSADDLQRQTSGFTGREPRPSAENQMQIIDAPGWGYFVKILIEKNKKPRVRGGHGDCGQRLVDAESLELPTYAL